MNLQSWLILDKQGEQSFWVPDHDDLSICGILVVPEMTTPRLLKSWKELPSKFPEEFSVLVGFFGREAEQQRNADAWEELLKVEGLVSKSAILCHYGGTVEFHSLCKHWQEEAMWVDSRFKESLKVESQVAEWGFPVPFSRKASTFGNATALEELKSEVKRGTAGHNWRELQRGMDFGWKRMVRELSVNAREYEVKQFGPLSRYLNSLQLSSCSDEELEEKLSDPEFYKRLMFCLNQNCGIRRPEDLMHGEEFRLVAAARDLFSTFLGGTLRRYSGSVQKVRRELDRYFQIFEDYTEQAGQS